MRELGDQKDQKHKAAEPTGKDFSILQGSLESTVVVTVTELAVHVSILLQLSTPVNRRNLPMFYPRTRVPAE